MNKNNMNKNYNADAIQVLKGLEAVRKRPGMYIGNTDDISGLHHMVYELVDNSIDEAMAGFCNKINVTIHIDGAVSVQDNGRGIPIDHHKSENMSAAEVIMTQLHAGGKFSQDSYEYSGGLHGVGAAVVVALSKTLVLTVYKNGHEYTMSFAKGKKTEELSKIGHTKMTGTLIKFQPDPEIFSVLDFDAKGMSSRLEELAFLNPGVEIHFYDERSGERNKYYNVGGLQSFVDHISKNKTKLHTTPIMIEGKVNKIQVSVAMLWTTTHYENSLFFTNTIQQKDGGTHVSGFRSALTRALQTYVKDKGTKAQQKADFTGDDIRDGLVAVLSIKVQDPKFSSQTKEKLVSSNVRQAVESIVLSQFSDWLEENPNETSLIIDKIISTALAREAARRARDLSHSQKSNANALQVSKKLAACSEKDPSKCELFIVEGNSAGGSAKQARNRFFQAVLPLRGKILNIEKVNFAKALASEVISTLISAIGTGIGDDFDLSKLRYHKIIIMTDSDVDGRHISALLLVFFFRYMQDIVTNGHLYISSPPLYGIVYKNKIDYVRDDEAYYQYMIDKGSKDITVDNNDSWHDTINIKDFLLDTASIYKELKLKQSWLLRSIIAAQAIDMQEIVEDDIPQQDFTLNVHALYHFLSSTDTDHEWMLDDNVLSNKKHGVKNSYDLHTLSNYRKYYSKIYRYINAWRHVWGANAEDNALNIQNPFEFLDKIIQKASKGLHVQRYKGLGEMNASELGSTAMCNYKKIYLEDIIEAEQNCSDLMGSDVTPRKQFIKDNALYAQLDV